ncbi:MAG TPA: alpha/beta fold hydrolase [Polyangiaceae bacterium]|nr:alpha/beta fold hydrolase [Polyangiaceae bacterium]
MKALSKLFSRRRWVCGALLTLGAAPLGVWLLMGVRIYLKERSYLHPPRGTLQHDRSSVGVSRLEDVRIPVANGSELSGWFAPSNNGAAVILTHGSMGDRSELGPEIRILADAGYGVLAFDWPGHGHSDGVVEWGAAEREALRAATDWIARRPDVDAERIGVFGFSMGGYIVAQVAAVDPRLRAVVLAGTPADVTEQTRWEYRRWGPFSVLPALWSQRLLGYEPDEDKAVRVVSKLAPRPVLVIGGARDEVVLPSMVQRLYAAAEEPKELLVFPSAAHGDYAKVASGEYTRRLREFFSVLVAPESRAATSR